MKRLFGSSRAKFEAADLCGCRTVFRCLSNQTLVTAFRIASLTGTLTVVSFFLASQAPATTMPRIGILSWSPCHSSYLNDPAGPFLRGLSDAGYRVDENVAIHCRSADRSYTSLATAAAELVLIPVDVLVSDNQPAAHALHEATSSIPIVTIFSGDPVSAGLAQNLASPGGNITGLSYYATELTAKRLELLKEGVPAITTIGVLANPNLSYLPFEEDTKRAADRLSMTATIYYASAPEEIDAALTRMNAESVQGVFVLPDLLFANEASRIAKLALALRLPSMAWGGWFTQAGTLMAYSTDYGELAHRLAFFVDRILQGANPAELPIEQPTTYKLSINLQTANALGVLFPQSIMLLADEIVE